MKTSIRIAPPNSLLFISDSESKATPEIARGPRLWATPLCIAVGCYPFMDGDTEVTLGAFEDVNPGGRPIFESTLSTPTRQVIVSTVEWVTLLSAPVSNASTQVKIWTNDPRTPDRIVIGLA